MRVSDMLRGIGSGRSGTEVSPTEFANAVEDHTKLAVADVLLLDHHNSIKLNGSAHGK